MKILKLGNYKKKKKVYLLALKSRIKKRKKKPSQYSLHLQYKWSDTYVHKPTDERKQEPGISQVLRRKLLAKT